MLSPYRVLDLTEVPHGAGMAMQFLRLHPEAQLALHRYVDQRPPETPIGASVSARVITWVRRIVEDCAQLGALARGDVRPFPERTAYL